MKFKTTDFKETDSFVTTCRLMTPMESVMLPPREGFSRFILSQHQVVPVIEASDIDAAVDYIFRFKLITAWRAAICFTSDQGHRFLVPMNSRDSAIEHFTIGESLYCANPAAAIALLMRMNYTAIAPHAASEKNIWRVKTEIKNDLMDAEVLVKYHAGAWTNPIRLLVFHSKSRLQKASTCKKHQPE